LIARPPVARVGPSFAGVSPGTVSMREVLREESQEYKIKKSEKIMEIP